MARCLLQLLYAHLPAHCRHIRTIYYRGVLNYRQYSDMSIEKRTDLTARFSAAIEITGNSEMKYCVSMPDLRWVWRILTILSPPHRDAFFMRCVAFRHDASMHVNASRPMQCNA